MDPTWTPSRPLDLAALAAQRDHATLADLAMRREKHLTGWLANVLVEEGNVSEIAVAKSHWPKLSGYCGKKSQQFSDESGEHDLAVLANGTPSLVVETKVAKPTQSGPQVPQTFCLFTNDILNSAITARLYQERGQVVRAAAVALVHEAILGATLNSFTNPWRWFEPTVDQRWTTNTLTLEPHSSVADSRERTWPNPSQPKTFKLRHITMILTGGTKGRLIGIYERQRAAIVLRYHIAVVQVKTHLFIACETSPLLVTAAAANDIGWNEIKRWLP